MAEGEGRSGACEAEDLRSFEERVLEHRRRLMRVAFLMLGNREDAEDVTQRSLMKAIQAQDRFRGDASLYTWLYRILVNQCKDRQKSRSRALRYVVGMPLNIESTAPSPEPDAQAELERRESETWVRQAIQQLSPALREILVLRHFEELAYEEIAEVLGCPIGTVRSRLSKAREKLRQVLERNRRH